MNSQIRPRWVESFGPRGEREWNRITCKTPDYEAQVRRFINDLPPIKEATMSVRAKFVVQQLNKTIWNGDSIVMAPVSGGSEEDKAFWKATPAGKIELNVLNPAAVVQFELGKAYYVDFTPAEA